MNVLSLFDGISAGQIALNRLGIKYDNYYASEIDKYAIQITQKNFPKTIQLGDVSKINGYNLPKIDLMLAGPPCQDLSIAKKNRQGLDGARSGLFWEFTRILKEVKPKYFLVENVASMSIDDCKIISSALGVLPIKINSALVSAQSRKRYYWTNIKGDGDMFGGIGQPKDKGILLKDILEDKPDIAPVKSKTVRVGGRGSGINDKYNWNTIKIGFLNKGGQGDRIYSIDGKSVSINSQSGGTGSHTGLYSIKDKIRKLSPIECERLQTIPDNYVAGISNTQRYKAIGNSWTVDVICHLLSHLSPMETREDARH